MPISEYLRDLRAIVGTRVLHVPSAAGLLRDDAGGVLLVQHAAADGIWACPGGAIDPGEAPQDAVVREVWEETGLLVEPQGLCGVFSGRDFLVRYDNGDEVIYVVTVFACRLVSGRLCADGDETLDARFVAADEIGRLRLAAWSRLVLPVLLGGTACWVPPVTWSPPAAIPAG